MFTLTMGFAARPQPAGKGRKSLAARGARGTDENESNKMKEPPARWHEWTPVGQDFLKAGMGGKRTL
jgi:hypothetical protein